MFVIQQMTDADLGRCIGTLRNAWLSRVSDTSQTTESERRWFRAYCVNDRACAFVARVNDDCVGYCLVSWLTHPTMTGTVAEIDEIHVAPTWTRQGIGRALVERSRKVLISSVGDLTPFAQASTARMKRHAPSGMRFEHYVLEFTDYLD